MNDFLPTGAFLGQLATARASYSLPAGAREATREVAYAILGLLFPHFNSNPAPTKDQLDLEFIRVKLLLNDLLGDFIQKCHCPADDITERFLNNLPEVYALLMEDAQAILDSDPAAENLDEVIFAYPGFFANAVYRIAHVFHEAGVEIFPRLLTEFGHHRTGIDIHPGAKIGRRFVIDHGTGVVIGATTVIGDDVKIYQGVTLGAMSVSKDLAAVKRHPTIEDSVVIYSNATILGGQTVVGSNSVIGGNVWLTESVPANSVVTRRSEVKVRSPHDPTDWIEYHI